MRKSVLSLMLLCSVSFAHGADFSVPLSDLDGNVINDDTPEKKPFTLGGAAIRALMASYPDEPNVSPEEKFKRAELASRIHNKPDLALSVDEASLVKRLIGKAYAPMVVFRAWPLLDPTTAPK